MRQVHESLASETPPALYALAEKMHTTTGGFAAYDYAKCVWLGQPNRDQRLAGEHPWPTRARDGQQYVYSVPVLAAVSPDLETVLYVGKDNWKSPSDPNAWLVAESNLFTGREVEHRVLTSSVDAGQQLWLQLAPRNFENMPLPMRAALYRQPRSEQIGLSAQLDGQYHTRFATLREGFRRQTRYEDYEALESMITMVRSIKEAHAEARRQQLKMEAYRYALGQHSLALAS